MDTYNHLDTDARAWIRAEMVRQSRMRQPIIELLARAIAYGRGEVPQETRSTPPEMRGEYHGS